jgi:predicted enzyme related to lactoylglutathione lyase
MSTKTEEAPAILGAYGTMYHVKDMAKAVQFFKKTLGLKPSAESAGWTEFALSGQTLCLSSGSKEEAARSGILILRVEEIKAARASLKAKGLTVSEITEVLPGAFACDFTDPSGNVIGIYQGPKA